MNQRQSLIHTIYRIVGCPQTADRQQVELMLQALNGLSERRRQILVLHKFHHWIYERISQHYGISRSAVEKICMDACN